MTSAAVQDRNEGATMLLYRVSKGVRDHAYVRRSEWACAAVACWWGLALLGPGDSFARAPHLHGFYAIATEFTWGLAFAILGLARVFALAINGTFQGTWYSQYSPHVRSAAAYIGAMLWLLIVFGILTGPEPLFPLATGLGAYFTFACLDIANALGTAKEAGWSEREARHGRV
jgi:hypothetical protein